MAQQGKAYSGTAIIAAAVLGGPLAAAWLLRRNFLAFDQSRPARAVLLGGIAITLALGIAAVFLPSELIDIPYWLILTLPTSLAALFIFDRLQKPSLRKYLADEGPVGTALGAFGTALLAGAVTLAVILLPRLEPMEPGAIYIGEARHILYFGDGVPREKAQAFGEGLEAWGYFVGREPRVVKLLKVGNEYQLLLPVKEDHWAETDLQRGIEELITVSRDYYDMPLIVTVVDDSASGKTGRTFRGREQEGF